MPSGVLSFREDYSLLKSCCRAARCFQPRFKTRKDELSVPKRGSEKCTKDFLNRLLRSRKLPGMRSSRNYGITTAVFKIIEPIDDGKHY